MGPVAPTRLPYLRASLLDLWKSRVGWLCGLFIGETLTGTALRHFDDELRAVISLVFFLPLIVSTGGNSGSQAATVVVRALALGEVALSEALRVCARELALGSILGATLGLVGVLRAALWGTAGEVAVCVGISLAAVVTLGTMVGAALPFLFERLGKDPAHASSPFVATFVDVLGILVYLTVAKAILGI